MILRDGMWARRRDGKIGRVRVRKDGVFEFLDLPYDANGRWNLRGEDHPLDIIAEVEWHHKPEPAIARFTPYGGKDGAHMTVDKDGSYVRYSDHMDALAKAKKEAEPEPVTGWLSVYRDSHLPHSREEADEIAKRSGSDRIACIQITYTPGEGL